MSMFTDKEITNSILNEHKLCASSLTNLVLESTNQNLRNDAENLLSKTFQHQKTLFDLMAQKGWYQVQNASQQDINTAKQEVGKLQTSGQM